jgi:hypothetical protein
LNEVLVELSRAIGLQSFPDADDVVAVVWKTRFASVSTSHGLLFRFDIQDESPGRGNGLRRQTHQIFQYFILDGKRFSS